MIRKRAAGKTAGATADTPRHRVNWKGWRRARQPLIRGWTTSLCVVACLWSSAIRAADDVAQGESPLAAARTLLLEGKHAEAQEAFAALKDADAVESAVGVARCQAAVGQYAEAAATLESVVVASPEAAPPRAELARLAFDRGDYPAAARWVDSALAIDANCLAAIWMQAELHRVSGHLAEADAATKRIVDYYTANDVNDPHDIRVCGLAAAQFARWNRRKGDFATIVNDLYPFALEQEPAFWPAHYESGVLFLEKYNQAEASKSFTQALELNPNAAEVHAGLARLSLQNYDLDAATRAIDRALELNPNLVEAHRLRADVLAANFKLDEAVVVLQEALRLNPVSEETLARLASCYVALDGLPADPAGTRYGQVRDEVVARNQAAGVFFYTMAEQLAERRKFTAAEGFYRQAIERMPQLVGPHAGLGMLYMRLGNEVEGEKLLNEAFEIDPFNLRVTNTLAVLDVLAGYAVIETDHFVLKFDRGQDEILARFAARYLEDEVYPELTRQFGFEPEGKSLFEIFNKAKNTNGHGWFSARMVGLPYIGTVGACAGKMVAMASPNSMEQKFNWARVLKHEFVHVLNLQQTNFNIPHWYTEALAVINEGYPRPQIWNELLAARVPAGELFNLDNINLGFIRPNSSLDWQMAYCQAELYAEYMLATYGDDALAKMLRAYGDNLNTRDALQRSFNVEQEDFERGYRDYLAQIAAGLAAGKPRQEQTLAQLQQAQRDNPEDADAAARLAEALVARKSYPQARELARQALAQQPKHALASYVLARIHLVVGDTNEAMELLTAAIDENDPQADALNLLASLRLKAKDFDEAARLYGLAASKAPHDARWAKALARVYLSAKDDARLTPVLVQLAEMDADDLTVRKKLAQLALAGKDHAAAARWAGEALQIDVQDADAHRMAAAARQETQEFARAIEHYTAIIQLQPKDQKARFGLAQACIADGQVKRGRQVLDELLKQSPDFPGARELLEKTTP
jgi:tetratricopeptide (TPR) repeat protein